MRMSRMRLVKMITQIILAALVMRAALATSISPSLVVSATWAERHKLVTMRMRRLVIRTWYLCSN